MPDDLGYFVRRPTTPPDPPAAVGGDTSPPPDLADRPEDEPSDEPDLWERFVHHETAMRTAQRTVARRMAPLYDVMQVLIAVIAIPVLVRIANFAPWGDWRYAAIALLAAAVFSLVVGIASLLPAVEVPRWARTLSQVLSGLVAAVLIALPFIFFLALFFAFW